MNQLTMKRILCIIMALQGIIAMNAQQLVASLYHPGDETPTIYTGMSAFSNAYEAAQDGDDIYLSPGIFYCYSTTFDKAVSIHGYLMDTLEGTECTRENSTTLINEVTIARSEVSTITPFFEGIYFRSTVYLQEMHGGTFSKCYFADLNGNSQEVEGTATCTFDNCILGNNRTYTDNNLTFTNCVVGFTSWTPPAAVDYYNCILWGDQYGMKQGKWGTVSNCIIFGTTDEDCTVSAEVFENCLLASPLSYDTENSIFLGSCYNVSSIYGIFQSDTFYELRSPTDYVDSDGNQIGIYGGEKPWDIIPDIPFISTFEPGELQEDGFLPYTLVIK